MSDEIAGKTQEDNLGITALLKGAREVLAKTRKEVMPKSKGFLRVKYINGRPYWYLVRSVRVNGKVKQEILAYYGSRKPRRAIE